MENIIRIDLKNVNCYLIKTRNTCILVDTGGYTFNDRPISNKQEILEEQLQENGCTPENLSLVILTHGDIDHIGNCRFLKETYKPTIILHKDDLDLTHNLTTEKLFANFRFRSLSNAIISKLMHSLFVKIANKIISQYEEFDIDAFADENFDLSKYNLDAQIIPLPGHTKGSIGILLKDGSFFCGDTFSNLGKPALSPNALSFRELKKSIKTLPYDKIKKVYPGHGVPFEFTEKKPR